MDPHSWRDILLLIGLKMSFDPILGVGRTPQITKDVYTNPTGMINTEISSAAIPRLTTSGDVETVGDIRNITNPDFDSTTFTAFTIKTNYTVSSQAIQNITWDLDKELFLKNAEFRALAIIGSGTVTTRVQYSLDGASWTNFQDNDEPDGANEKILRVQNYFRVRFIRVQTEWDPDTVPQTTELQINSLRIVMDYMQR